MKKIKIVKCSKTSYWYNDRIGETFDVISEHDFSDGVNYKVIDPSDGVSSYILASDAVEVFDKPRLYEHEGKQHILPDWAKYVTSHTGNEKVLSAWEKKPEWRQGIFQVGEGFWHGKDNGMRETLVEYIKPLPDGAFIVEV